MQGTSLIRLVMLSICIDCVKLAILGIILNRLIHIRAMLLCSYFMEFMSSGRYNILMLLFRMCIQRIYICGVQIVRIANRKGILLEA